MASNKINMIFSVGEQQVMDGSVRHAVLCIMMVHLTVILTRNHLLHLINDINVPIVPMVRHLHLFL